MKRCYSCFHEFEDIYEVCPFCGQIEITQPEEPIQLYPGTVLAQRYMIGTAVGAGGFGIVYKAWDMKLETIVAVKEFFVSRLVTRVPGRSELIVTKKMQTEFLYRKERFLAEARNMAKFRSHRNMPNVFEFFEENNTGYIVMELLKGNALNNYITENGDIVDVDFALMIANEVGAALKDLHEKNIIHRDVAPDNIFISTGSDIRIKLMDLGAAKLADTTDNVIDIILKPGYSPTEQYDNSKNIGPWTDIYALGATLYMMLTGIKPDESTNRKIKDVVVPPHEINPLISENLSNTIMKAMAVERHMRFRNISDFLSAMNGEKQVVTLAKEKKRRRAKRATGITAAVIAATAISGVVLHTYDQKKGAEQLDPADISIWFAVDDGSAEETAMGIVVDDFREKYPDVNIELRGIPAADYLAELQAAAAQGTLPDLFESTDIPADLLEGAVDVSEILNTSQADECLFLDQYSDGFSNRQIPLAIEVPAAYVVTAGPASIEYEDEYLCGLADLGSGVNIAADTDVMEMLDENFGEYSYCDEATFFAEKESTSPVLLSTTLRLDEVKTRLAYYRWNCVFPDNDRIYCNYTYKWSVGTGTEAETAAAKKLLSWMLGNVYQTDLMISYCSDGQLPVNRVCFEQKIMIGELTPISGIYNKFVFESED